MHIFKHRLLIHLNNVHFIQKSVLTYAFTYVKYNVKILVYIKDQIMQRIE